MGTIREIGDVFKLSIESDVEAWRADTFFTKEPETIEWIKSFKDGDVFYDIGANIGVYSLYAGKLYPNSKIYSFEPDMKNYLRLLENISLNELDNCFPLYLAIANKGNLGVFFCKEDKAGSSGGQFGNAIDEVGKEFKPVSTLPIISMSLSEFIFNFGGYPPNHIKIDVDGKEIPILLGMSQIFHLDNLKSFLVELNNPIPNELDEKIKGIGFSRDNKFNWMSPHSRERRAKEGSKAENVIFTRKSNG